MILETERLILREMGQADFHDLAEILQDPKVMYAYEHDFSESDVQEWLDRQADRYRKYGFGLWAAKEAACGCKEYAFQQLNRDKVYSIIKADNFASIKVAESIGMSREDEFITRYYNGDMLHFLYCVRRQPSEFSYKGR